MDEIERNVDQILLHTVIESVPLRVFWKDRDLRYLGCNRRFARDAGLDGPEQLIGKTDFDMSWKHEADGYRADDRQVMETGKSSLGYEESQTTPDGETIWLRTSKVPLRDADNSVVGILGIYEEITELKRAEAAQQHLNRALRLLSSCNSTLVHATDETKLLTDICRLAVDTGGYRMAWVGFAEFGKDKIVRPVAEYGFERGYLGNANITWSDSERGRGPTGTCIRTGRTQVNQNFLDNPRMSPWREQALQRGFRSSIALPLKDGASPLGSLTIYAYEPDAFAVDEVKLLEELAGDLAYGIITLRTRADLVHSREKLLASLEESIQAIAATVDSRDPYTSGHQKRTATLCDAIARELGMPAERIHGLHLAAAIHDLGNVRIPSDILNKPGPLTPAEMELVKTHAQVGHDIIKDIDFPWPIAEIILQHHEYMDGSGYPCGLKGDALLLESRILTVANVVEAMMSYRPCRDALGYEATIAEIRNYRGTKYDADVVDACLEVLSSGNPLDKITK